MLLHEIPYHHPERRSNFSDGDERRIDRATLNPSDIRLPDIGGGGHHFLGEFGGGSTFAHSVAELSQQFGTGGLERSH